MTAGTDQLDLGVSAVKAEIANLVLANSGLSGQVAALTTTNATLAAENAALKAQIANPPTTGLPPMPAGWTKTLFQDLFDGTAVDLTKWNVRNDSGQNNNNANNLASNVKVSGGVCSIKGGPNPAGSTDAYNAGYIDTKGKTAINQVSGYWEARIRFPWGANAWGLWPAWWMRDTVSGGEIDIMEAWPKPAALHATVFGDTMTGTPKISGGQVAATFDPTTWHTYAVQKEPGVLRFFYDGVMVWDCYAGASATQVSWLDAQITKNGHPWEIRICLQIGGSYGGLPTATTDFSKTFDLDYVRILGR